MKRIMSVQMLTLLMIVFGQIMPKSRAIEQASPSELLDFDTSIFDQAEYPALYAGVSVAPPVGQRNFSLVRTILGNNLLGIQGIAPARVRIGFGEEVDNPLFGQRVNNLALLGHEPVVTVLGDSRVYLVVCPETGAVLYRNEVLLKDAGGNDLEGDDNPVSVATTSGNTLFAAIPQSGNLFSDFLGLDRGVAVLHKDSLNARLVQQGMRATRLNMTQAAGIFG